MALPNSGPMSASAIQAEFGGSPGRKLSDYYAGGPYVPSSTPVPASGAISLSQFYGRSKLVAPNYAVYVLGTVNVTPPWTGSLAASGWPDPSAQWLWNSAGAAAGAPAEVNITFQALVNNPSGSPQSVTIYCGIDNSGSVYLNSTLVCTVSTWTPCTVANATLLPGSNLIRVVGRNGSTVANPAGMVFSLYSAGVVLLRSGDPGWSWTY